MIVSPAPEPTLQPRAGDEELVMGKRKQATKKKPKKEPRK